MSALAAEVAAIRGGVTLTRHAGLAVARLPAREGIAQLDPVVASALALREAQFRQGLCLDDAGRPTADLLLGCFRGSLHVIGAGAMPAPEAQVADAVVFGVDGPFAWELLAEWDTPGVIGLPYLGAYAPREGVLVIRAGRTGEYGYLLVCAAAVAEAVWASLCAAGAPLGAVEVGRDALRHCALENWVFELDREGAAGLDALELQLTWRLDLGKDARGLDAIRAHRARGLQRRLTALTAPTDAAVGAEVSFAGRPIGAVVASAPDLGGDGWRILAALQTAWAHPGIAAYTVGGAPCRTVSAPWVLNRSLFVNPQRHAWATRAEIELPPGLRWPT